MEDNLKKAMQELQEKYDGLDARMRKIEGGSTSSIGVCTDDSSGILPHSQESSSTRREEPRVMRESYPTKYKKGCALVIVNSFKYFRKYGLELGSAEEDLKLMRDLWVKTLGCDLFMGEIHVNQTAKQMKILLKEMSKIEGKYDYVVVVISTHGGLYPESAIDRHEVKEKIFDDTKDRDIRQILEEAAGNAENKQVTYESFERSQDEAISLGEKSTAEVFFGDDYRPVREREVKKYFYNTKISASLRNIPKFFILNYCRGFERDTGDQAMTDPIPREVEVTSLLPSVSDVLVVYATHPDFVAWTNKEHGSWLISNIKKVFKSHYRDTDVVTMLTMVNKEMKSKTAEKRYLQYKAMSVFESSLDKDFYLKGPESREQSAPEAELQHPKALNVGTTTQSSN